MTVWIVGFGYSCDHRVFTTKAAADAACADWTGPLTGPEEVELEDETTPARLHIKAFEKSEVAYRFGMPHGDGE